MQNSIWQCGRSCSSQRHIFNPGDRVEVVGRIKDSLGDMLILRTKERTVRIEEPLFKKSFYLINK